FILRNQVKKRTMELEQSHEAYRKSEEKLQRSQKLEAVGLLAGGIAHDFNNILTVINGYSRMLLENENLDAEVRDSVKEILKAGKKAASLTKKLLTFSRTTIDEFKVIDINNLILDVDKMLHRLISEDVEFILDLEDGECLVLADSASIEQMLINLVINARDAVGPHDRIQIRTRKHEGNKVKIYIEDNGIGMDKDIISHLFEPFFTTKEVGKGTGLGLSTVYGIVKQLKGTINVESEKGKGSTFIITLPLVSERPQSIDSIGKKEQYTPQKLQKRILLVEDNQSVQKITQKILEDAGFQIVCAKNGNEALNSIKAGNIQFDLVLSDIIMPEMNGFELKQECKKICPNLRFLFISGYPAKKVEERGIQIDPSIILKKPYLPEELLHKISELIS
ncbi:MAG: ATP-binding protein, partial [Promethearchaeota archaeon]